MKHFAFVSAIAFSGQKSFPGNVCLPRTNRFKPEKSHVQWRPTIVATAPVEPPSSSEQDKAQSTEQTETTLILETEALDPSAGSVIVPATFNLAGTFMFFGGLCVYLGDGWLVAGLPLLALGLLLSVQTFRVRFVFGPTRLSVARKSGEGLKMIRGWKYEQITNWELWWKRFPVLVYFKESESYNGRGSIHFFPALYKGDVLLSELRKRTPHLDKAQYD